MSAERIWESPAWYVRVLRDLAPDLESRMEDAATRGLDKYSRGRNMQTRENLRYAADYIEYLTALSGESAAS